MKKLIEKINNINNEKFVSTVVIMALAVYIFYSIMLSIGLAQKWANLPSLICLGSIFTLGYFIKKENLNNPKNKNEEVDLC